MKHPLKTLIRVRDWTVDEKSRVLANRLRDLDAFKEQARGLEREVKAEQETAKASPSEAGMAYSGYARGVLHRRARLEKAIADTEAAVCAAKDDVAQAYRDLKTVELAQESRERRDVEEAERRQTATLDEMALQGFRRRGADR